MAKQPENSIPEAGSNEKPDEASAKTQYEKRIEDAVVDAQYMLMYASTNCPKDINQDTLEKLIKIRHRVEKEQQLSVDDEIEFWLAYQDLRKLIWPVTAESIKANLPTERSSISKARRIVNWYIVFTVFVLGLVLFFQIYWVIGNQLSAQLDQLVEAEKNLKVQVNENTQENLQKDLDSLESQLLQTSIIFLDWSSPWNSFITDENLGTSSEYAKKYEDIDAKIQIIDAELTDDSYAKKAAANDKDILNEQKALIDESGNTTLTDDINKKIALVNQKSALEQMLASLDEKKGVVQGQIDDKTEQKRILEANLNNITADTEGNLAGQKSLLTARLINLNAQLTAMATTSTPEATTTQTVTEPTSTPDGTTTQIATESTSTPEVTTTQTVTDLMTDREAIQRNLKAIDDVSLAQAADIQGQISAIDTELGIDPGSASLEIDTTKLQELLKKLPLDAEAISLAIDGMTSQSTLVTQLAGLEAARGVIQAQIENLQLQIDNLHIDTTTLASNDLNAKIQILADKIVTQLKEDRQQWETKKEELKRQEQVDSIKEDSRPVQLAGQFVLNILQSYLLPLLYGILGATTFVLRSLSRKIKEVSYSEVGEIQHLLHISLGALAGILVGWFSFLIPNEGFIGSVSPLAIAFLVGYNIELLFSKMDDIVVTKLNEIQHRTSATVYKEERTADLQKASPVLSTLETSSEETPADSEAKG